jgi:hypothetical protein
MCVSAGGTLTQDIHACLDTDMKHLCTEHYVQPSFDSVTFKKACLDDWIRATSLHHQCVNQMGPGMRIAAYAVDGTPEAIESKDGLWLGVQFHPEMSAYENEQAFNIFRWLVKTAAFRKGGRARAVKFRDAAEDYYDRLAWTYQQYKRDQDQREVDDAWQDYLDGLSDTRSDYYPYQLDSAEEEYRTGKAASNPGGPAKGEGKTRRSRRAGEPSIPSMRETTPSQREMVNDIETGKEIVVWEGSDRPRQNDDDYIEGTCEEIPHGLVPLGYGYETPRSDSRLELELKICPTCHILFDCIEDCDDHKKYVHPVRVYDAMRERYPDMNEPPCDSPSWDDVKSVIEAAQEAGLDVTEIND